MSDTVTMSYGTYNFNPVPTLNLSKEYRKTEDGRILRSVSKIQLDGTLLAGTGTAGWSFTNTVLAKDRLSSGLSVQGCPFVIKCNGNILFSGNPLVNGLSFKNSQNNWVDSVGYNVELEYSDNITGELNTTRLDAASEDWSIESLEDKPYYYWSPMGTPDSRALLYKLTHNLSAKGSTSYISCGGLSESKEAWEYARDFCSGHVGTGSIFGLPSTGYNYFNHSRTQSVQKYNGNYTVQETWLVFNSGAGVPGNAIEDYNIDIKYSSESDIIGVTVQGSIQGLETKTYNTLDIISQNIITNKYQSASGYFSAITGGLIYNRAQQALLDAKISSRALNPTRYNKSIGYNLGNGTINYSYDFNNRPSPCVSGALTETISLNVDYPTDVYASIQVLGRTSGPIFQLMNTRTALQYKFAIDVTVPMITGCNILTHWQLSSTGCPHNTIKTYLTTLENGLVSEYGQIVKQADNITWNPKEGKYARGVTWLISPCTGAGTSVSILP